MGLARPSGMLRLIHMLESAWNITEPVQVMVHVEHAQRARLHDDHGEMLTAFLDRDVDRLLSLSAAHHRRLNDVVATLPADAGLVAEDG
jgi:DNA-binding GntR family transcriptional regulator